MYRHRQHSLYILKYIQKSFEEKKALLQKTHAAFASNLKVVHNTIDKLVDYFRAKDESKQGVGLFQNMYEPTIDQVGYLMAVTAGHNGGFNLSETNTLKFHLLKAGFIEPEAFLDSKNAESSVESLVRCPRALGIKAKEIRQMKVN